LVFGHLESKRSVAIWGIFDVFIGSTLFCLLIVPGMFSETIALNNFGVGTSWIEAVMVILVVMMSSVVLFLVSRSDLTQAWVAHYLLWLGIGVLIVSLRSHVQFSI